MKRFVCNRSCLAARRFHSSLPCHSTTSDVQVHEGRVYVDSVFPVQLGFLDFRRYIGYTREESLLASLRARLSSIKAHSFEVVSLHPSQKEGGALVQFRYRTSGCDVADALQTIQTELQTEALKDGSMPTWSSLTALGGKPWIVKGSPFLEDMERFPSTRLKTVFEGPDVHEELLYELFRPYGRIENITGPQPLPSTSFRFSVVTFHRIRSATIARNVLHGLTIPSSPSTRLRITYEPPIQAHVIRDWISNHPRTFFPILIFLLGSLTYAVFDPIRSLMIQAKMLDWFEFREFKLYKWLRKNALERLYTPTSPSVASGNEMWKERKDADATVRAYLVDSPTTVAFIHGPAGSGKTSMLQSVLQDTSRKSLIIDCRELMKASTDSRLVAELARQTGYWPIFTFLNSLNNLIDLASVGLIGQKAGLNSSVIDQVQEILNVVSTALKGVSSSHRVAIEKQMLHQQKLAARKTSEEQRRQRIEHGLWHDGRLDCVAGNGIISELGFGDERIWDDDKPAITIQNISVTPEHEEEAKKHYLHRSGVDAEAINALPIVIIRNFTAKTGSSRTDLLNVLAQWAASLAENQIAHIIIVSDNRENVKRIAKALPTKPLTSIALYDADAASSLSFVQRKLRESGIEMKFSSQEIAYIERLGGRASDLESLIHKVRNGQNVQDAVEDIITRGVGELRKSAFGDDVEDAKNLPWSREQAWAVLKQLSRSPEIPYHDLLLDYPFKGDEAALRSMEHAELITINTSNGRPSTIRPGKPVFRWVFERLVNDIVFQAIQEIAFNEKMTANAESTVKACEQELLILKEITKDSSWLSSHSASNSRASYLSKKMYAAEKKIEALEKKNTNWRYLLSKNNLHN